MMMHSFVSQGSETKFARPVFDCKFYLPTPGCIVHLLLNLLILYAITKRGKRRKGLILMSTLQSYVFVGTPVCSSEEVKDCWSMTPNLTIWRPRALFLVGLPENVPSRRWFWLLLEDVVLVVT